MAKGKKHKLKKKKAVKKKVARKKAKSKKTKSSKKKITKVKKKKAKKISSKKKKIKKELKKSTGDIKKEKVKAKKNVPEVIQVKQEEPPAVQTTKGPSPKTIARAKAAFAAKEKQKNSFQPIDKTAAEKQLKLVEPKNKLVLEYIIHSSPGLLYEFITSPSGLSEWFADNVNIVGSTYSFLWEGAEQKAKLLSIKENKSIRFQWTDRSPNTYFELRIEKNELTEELSLIITDFAENPDEMNSLEVLWQGQIQRLMKVLGSKI